MVTRGEVGGGMGEIGGGRGGWFKESTCCDEHRVMYGSVESLHCTETNIMLYVN